MTCSCETCWTSVCHRYGKPCISIVAWSASLSPAHNTVLPHWHCTRFNVYFESMWAVFNCIWTTTPTFLSFFLFFCLFGETMFICNRRNPFRDVRTWGHLQNIAPRVALRLVSHMPFLTSYAVFTVPGAGEKTPLKIITQKWTNWIFSHVDF